MKRLGFLRRSPFRSTSDSRANGAPRRRARVEFDVVAAGQYVVLALDQAGTESLFPLRTAAPVGAVHVLHIALSEVLHEQARAVRLFRGEEQVDMVGRQDVGMHRAAKAGGVRFQVMAVENVVVLLTEATDYRLVVVSFLLLLPISSLLR